VSGDVNPIHLSDVTARAFGFRAAIAHGMWSLARCAAELGTPLPADAPRVLEVQFRLPVFLPGWLSLRQGVVGRQVRFALLDSQGEKTHLAGSLSPLA
jgi:acyl dehydratase